MKLDIGCSDKKKEGYTGLDARALPGVDIVHDLEVTPWPIEDGACEEINASHVLEHIKPWKIFGVMDECHRVLKPGGLMTIATPFGMAYKLDPTHMIEFEEASFLYWDSEWTLYDVYKPKPWRRVSVSRDMSLLVQTTAMERK